MKSFSAHTDGVYVFTKGGSVPSLDPALRSWKPPSDWRNVPGQDHSIDEPPLPTHKKVATGLIMREPDGRVWMTRSTNEFGGYKHSFPKGKLEPDLHPQANAIKEAYEETGLKGRITGHAGDYEGDTSVTRYYHAVREDGHPHDHGWESEAVVLAPGHRSHEFLNRQRDQQIAHDHLGAPEPTAKF